MKKLNKSEISENRLLIENLGINYGGSNLSQKAVEIRSALDNLSEGEYFYLSKDDWIETGYDSSFSSWLAGYRRNTRRDIYPSYNKSTSTWIVGFKL